MQEPPASALAWVAGELGGVMHWSALPQASRSGPWRLDLADGRRVVLALVDPNDPGHATEMAALLLCAKAGVPAPRMLVRELTGALDGQAATVQSWIPGSSRVPTAEVPGRAVQLGRAAALIHHVRLDPTLDLPSRTTSLQGVDFASLPVPAPDVELFARLRQVLAATPAPAGRSLVHGDLWQGNTLWQEDRLTAVVDWDYAGVGHPTIDLGTLRWDLTVLNGGGADDVLFGWQQASGSELTKPEVAWGDVSALCASPPDLTAWLGNFHSQGRPDLTLEIVRARRNAFARAAIDVLR